MLPVQKLLAPLVVLCCGCSASVAPQDDGWPTDASGSGLLIASLLQTAPHAVGPAVHNPGWTGLAVTFSSGDILEEQSVGACRLRRTAIPACPGVGDLSIIVGSESHPLATDTRGCPYQSVSVPGSYVATGTTVRFETQGQLFGAVSVSASLQTDVTVQTPTPAPNGRISAASASGLDVRWSGRPRYLEVEIKANFTGLETRTVTCLFDGSIGIVTVPSDVLSFVRGAESAGILIFGSDRATGISGSWRIDFRVRNAALITPIDVQ